MPSILANVAARIAAPRPLGALLLVLTGLVYAPGLAGGFHFDDYHVIVDNPHLVLADSGLASLLDAAFSTATGPLLRPLSMLSFAANRSLVGPTAASFLWTNLALHGLNALLVLALVRALCALWLPALGPTRRAGFAAAIALVWALHPLNLSAVLYIVQRMTLLAATGLLGGCLLYLHARPQPSERWSPGALFGLAACGVLACAAKEIGLLLLPLLAWLAIACRAARGERAQARRLAAGAVAGVIALGALLVWVPGLLPPDHAGGTADPLARVLTECRVLWRYLALTLWPDPRDFALFHDALVVSRSLREPWTTLPAVLGIAVLIGLAVGQRPRWLAFGCGWFLACHLLESTVYPLEPMHEHRNYLALLGPLLVVACGLLGLGRVAPRVATAVAVVALCACGAVTTWRAALWADPLAHMAFEARHHPASARTRYELGRLRIEAGAAAGDDELLAAGRTDLRTAAELAAVPLLPWTAELKIALVLADAPGVARALTALSSGSPWLAARALEQLVECQVREQCPAAATPVQHLAGSALGRAAPGSRAHAHALEWLAVFYLRLLGDGAAGLALLDEAVAARPQDLALAVRRAEALAARGQPEAARRAAGALAARLPWHAAVSARPLWRRVRALQPTAS